MKSVKVVLLLLLCAAAVHAAEKKVLTIGNSFTWSLATDLPAIAKAQGEKLKLAFANHGGCSIQRHWKYVSEEEAKDDVKYYQLGKKKAKLREVLASDKWDIVTIQQVSTQSWVKGSFYPEVDKLISYVRKHAPHAQIVFQQTWAYRSDANTLKKWKITHEKMYQGICQNYAEANKKFGFDVIPAGLAVKIATEEQPVKFTAVSPEVRKNTKVNEKISQPGSLHVGWRWRKNKKTGKVTLACDTAHLNERGKYLQACVWYGYIFGKSPLTIKFNPKNINPKDAEFLRKCADKALKTSPFCK